MLKPGEAVTVGQCGTWGALSEWHGRELPPDHCGAASGFAHDGWKGTLRREGTRWPITLALSLGTNGLRESWPGDQSENGSQPVSQKLGDCHMSLHLPWLSLLLSEWR